MGTLPLTSNDISVQLRRAGIRRSLPCLKFLDGLLNSPQLPTIMYLKANVEKPVWALQIGAYAGRCLLPNAATFSSGLNVNLSWNASGEQTANLVNTAAPPGHEEN